VVDLAQARVNKLIQMSDHCRRLADGVLPLPVSAEIAAVADELDREVVRMKVNCLGSRVCPCESRDSCLAADQLVAMRKVA
jgi:hypothetical protein